MNKYIAEAFGTFAFVFMGCATIIFMGSDVGALGISFAFGLAFLVMIYTVGPVSGAHLNPAVSLGLWASGRLEMSECFSYIVAQIAGGFVAAFALHFMGGDPGSAATTFSTGGMHAALIFEFVATFVFVMVIISFSCRETPSPVAGLVIGLTLVLVHLAGISISGASVNPARSIVTNVFGDTAAMQQLWLYIVVPIAAALCAGWISRAFSNCDKPAS